MGKRVRIYIGGQDRAPDGDGLLAYALLKFLSREGAAGATLFRGTAGFGAHGKLHTARLADLVPDLPLVIEWLDGPERVERLLPHIQEMVAAGVITVEDIDIVKYVHRAPRELPPDRVADVMTRKVTSIHPDTPLGEVVRILIASDFRAVPVVDADQKLVGIVSNNDLVERGGLPARLDLLARLQPEVLERELADSGTREKTAGGVMTREVVSVREDAPLATAAELMVERKIKRLPVTDSDGHLVGMISRVDVLRTLGEDLPLPDAEHGDRPARSVGDLAHEIPTVGPDAPIGEVIDAVTATRLNRAVVIDKERHVLGVIGDAEVLARVDPGHRAGVLGALMGRSTVSAGGTAKDVMIAPFTTIAAGESIEEASRLMTSGRLKVLPVIDAQGKLVGGIDRADLLRSIRERA